MNLSVKANIILKPRLVLINMIILMVVMFGLPFFSVENYSIISNTTSHLGSQLAPNASIMNITFIIMGTACIIESRQFLKTYWVHQVLLIVFLSVAKHLLFKAFHHPFIGETLRPDIV